MKSELEVEPELGLEVRPEAEPEADSESTELSWSLSCTSVSASSSSWAPQVCLFSVSVREDVLLHDVSERSSGERIHKTQHTHKTSNSGPVSVYLLLKYRPTAEPSVDAAECP